jgi:hypothetical protein
MSVQAVSLLLYVQVPVIDELICLLDSETIVAFALINRQAFCNILRDPLVKDKVCKHCKSHICTHRGHLLFKSVGVKLEESINALTISRNVSSIPRTALETFLANQFK